MFWMFATSFCWIAPSIAWFFKAAAPKPSEPKSPCWAATTRDQKPSRGGFRSTKFFFEVQKPEYPLAGTAPERQARWNSGRAFGSWALWGFVSLASDANHCKSLQISANLCPLQRASNLAYALSDSTRTSGQAQSSSSDAAAEQLRQEIESLRAEAAQVPFSPF